MQQGAVPEAVQLGEEARGGHGAGLGGGESERPQGPQEEGTWGRRGPRAGLQVAAPKADASGLSGAAPKMPTNPLPGQIKSKSLQGGA